MDQRKRAAARGGAKATAKAITAAVAAAEAEAVANMVVRVNVPPARGGEQEMELCISIKTGYPIAGSIRRGN